MKKVLIIILNIFLWFMVLISLLLIIERFVFKNNIPSIMGISYMQVVTGSMEPTYKINDFILIKKTDDVVVNDVVVYKESNYYVTHRLIEITDDNYITKGDANNTSETINKDQVVGKVIYYNEKVSIIINILRNPVVLILIGGIVLLVGSLLNTHDEEKKTKKANV